MDTKKIGQRIADLRKEKGVKQDELARALNISAQAVSKWENGGAPDIELIPAIADFFDVSTDALFGRDEVSGAGLAKAITAAIQSVKWEERIEKAFEICGMIEKGFFGQTGALGKPDDCGEKDEVFSKMLTDNGYTDMGLGNRIRYFLCVPDADDKNAAFLNGVDYPALFSDLGKKDVFDSAVFILKRKNPEKRFTKNLLANELNLSPDRAEEILKILMKYSLLYSNTLEIDERDEKVYAVNTNASTFVSLLIFAQNLMVKPHSFCYYNGGKSTAYL